MKVRRRTFWQLHQSWHRIENYILSVRWGNNFFPVQKKILFSCFFCFVLSCVVCLFVCFLCGGFRILEIFFHFNCIIILSENETAHIFGCILFSFTEQANQHDYCVFQCKYHTLPYKCQDAEQMKKLQVFLTDSSLQ